MLYAPLALQRIGGSAQSYHEERPTKRDLKHARSVLTVYDMATAGSF